MAWVEAAVVYYLRLHIDRIVPYQPYPLPVVGGLGTAELVREAATLMMLWTVGILAGRNWASRLGYSAIAFGIWDIFYYVFLWVLTDWPKSVWDWDILFLLPLPWWGPVLAPVAISLLMITWGTLVTHFEDTPALCRLSWRSVTAAVIGMFLALGVFMADSFAAAGQGIEALRNLLPTRFNWPLFSLALLLMATPVLSILRRRYSSAPSAAGPATSAIQSTL
jgi:hypothetical protein